MFVFWWVGRGYLTAVIVLATMIVFGVLLTATMPLFKDGLRYWGVVLIVSAAANWLIGSRINRRRRGDRARSLAKRLFYRGGHRFMSMPMETFSIVIAAAGVLMCAAGLRSQP